MGGRRLKLDLAACWSVLLPADRARIGTWAEVLTGRRDGWRAVPWCVEAVQALALVYLAAERGGNALDALAEAAEALGLPDDPELNTRPSDNLARKMRLWRARARALETGIPAPRADAA